MDLNQFLKKELCNEQFNGCPAFMTMTTQGFLTPVQTGFIPAYSLILCYFKNQQGYWITSVDDQKKIAKKIVSIHLRNPKTINNFYQQWKVSYDQLLKFYYQKFPEDLKIISNSELLDWQKQLYAKYKQVVLPGFSDAFMFYADQRLHQLVNNNEIFTTLSAPINLSFIQQQEWEVNKLQKINNKKQIEKHLLKYSWSKSSYAGYKKYNFPRQKIKIYPSSISKNKIAKKRLFKKYKFDPEIIALTELTELFIKWQDERKIYSLSFVTLLDKFLKEIAKRSEIDSELLKYAMSNEFNSILSGQFNKSELINRQKNMIVVYSKDITRIITGIKAKKIFQQATEREFKKEKQLTGFPAFLGQVKGKVIIVSNIKQIGEVKKGDILVTSMTRPEHLPAMKKAAAIITDDGGITCHASIIARELGKPCIIGTKIATQILKTGELVEVDANKGIIRIL